MHHQRKPGSGAVRLPLLDTDIADGDFELNALPFHGSPVDRSYEQGLKWVTRQTSGRIGWHDSIHRAGTSATHRPRLLSLGAITHSAR
jgi:hypothetical protein